MASLAALTVAAACSASDSRGAASTIPYATVPVTTLVVVIDSSTVAPPTPSSSTSSTSSTSTTNPDVVSVTIARGELLPDKCNSGCKQVVITTSGWANRQALEIICYSSSGTTGPFAKTADNTGSFESSTLCFFGNVSNVYVTVNGVSSDVVSSWKDW